MDIRKFFERRTTREKKKKGRESSSGSDENDNHDKTTHVMPRSLDANIGQASHSPAEPVMFINQKSGEYQFYNINITVTASQIVASLKFESRARETVQQQLVLANPLSEDADFYLHCDSLVCQNMINISKKSQATTTLSYSPLVVGESDDALVVSNTLVGDCIYKIFTKCLPAKEIDLELTTPIGTSLPLRLKVQNRTEFIASFTSSISHPSIQADQVYSLDPLEKGKFLVWFEPTALGIQTCRVSFNSPSAGEFIYNIKGEATDPKPQGPLRIRPAGFTTIQFKNVFEDTRVFKIYTDREVFYVKTQFETVKGKKEVRVTVFLMDMEVDDIENITGCLTIECYDPPEPNVQWTYFLQGVA